MQGRVLTACAIFALVLSACGVDKPVYSPEAAKQVSKACIEQVNAVGTYSFRQGQHGTNLETRLPRATPITGGPVELQGTQQGADAINACIKLKAQRNAAVQSSAGTIIDQQTYDPSSTSGGTAAATATVASTSSTVPRRTATTSFGCPKYADVLHGGKLYCTR
ncbi:MAG: hypothetical protein GJ677_03300 [Rhodobacteraceae bacterium]|nr:hypothetical protein [Paracoccaceae bacterium]